MLITTGADVAEQPRAYNQTLAETLASLPAHHELDAPPASRAARARGEGPFPAPVLLDEGEDRMIPGRAGGVPLRVFTPPVVRGVYLHIHGGGWTLGTAAGQDIQLWRLARAAEVAVVSVGYRLAPEHPYPAGPDDCEDAARWLVAEAVQAFGTDRLTIGGESAGAHLAVVTLLRLGAQAAAFRAAQLAFGAYDLSAPPSFAPRTAASRRSAPVRSALVRSAPRRSAPMRYVPRSPAPVRSAPLRRAPTRSAPLWSSPCSPRARSPARRSRTLTFRRVPATSSPASLSGLSRVSRSTSSRARARSPVGCSVIASVRYQSRSCRSRMTGKTANIRAAVSGARRQSRPAKVTWATFCPAPKQS